MEKKNRNGRKARKVMAAFLAASLAAGILGGCGQTAADTADAKEVEITNVSYDPTRELYQAYNALFAEHWKEPDRTGCDGGSVARRFRQAGA